ncbi:MAG: hypothetical protein DWQ44_01695 [Bacteroidetes bacterium]|nr:MAG: hypothetical protein DWQ33_05425 [Bacteroidota bacterium]REK04692.1 MAG: hypothetical protein DWQ39_05585 [Bacteroidota bacterium]REK36167.1 MAG: hypothetical protein DWQ44_01695 [Bacteroidota bacterium]REK51462.1 MAG: hypothetical protein DWQ48_01140 [Bacteroidota bacterium]
MGFDEITPHLNKISTLYLKNNKRKVGWIFVDKLQKTNPVLKEIYFISVQKGKRIWSALENHDMSILLKYSESIPVGLIERIRSTKG